MLFLRKCLFFCFLLIYLIFCPLLILYALGIIFKPDTQSLQKTGIIYLSTLPPEAVISVNKERFGETTPAIIRNLPPANYAIKISLKNYKPWQRTLSVEATQATAAENILLIPRDWDIQNIIPEPFQELISFPEHPFFLLKKGPLLQDIAVCRWKEALGEKRTDGSPPAADFTFPLIPAESPFWGAKVRKTQTIPGSPFVFIQAEIKGVTKSLWVDLEDSAPLVQDISDLFPTPPETVAWDKDAKDILYTFHQDAIDFIDISSHTISPNIIKDVRAFTLYEHHLYALMKDHLLQRFNAQGEDPQPLLSDPQLAATLFGAYKKLSLSVLSEKIILFLSDQGTLISNQLPYQFVPKGVKGFKLDHVNNRLLVWKDADVGFIDFNERPAEGIFEKGPLLVWLNLSAKNIPEAFWINDGAQILYVDGEDILLTETESFGKQETHEVVRKKKGTDIHYSSLNGRLFFLDEKTGHLKSIKIIPTESMFPVSEPPDTEELKKKERPKEEHAL